MNSIRSAKFVVSSPDVGHCPKSTMPEYAFIGRSNVGKSSLINMLAGNVTLAKTSATPGKTTLINHFIINDEWYIVDLPGYGYAKRGKAQVEQIRRAIEGYILQRQQLTCLFLLIDSRHEPQKIDLDFIRFLGENGVPFALVFTKADKCNRSHLKDGVDTYLKKLSEEWEELPAHFVTSSLKRTGRNDILDYIFTINEGLK